MYDFLLHFHSGWRWVLLVLLFMALYTNFTGWRSGRARNAGDAKTNLHLMAAAHLQGIVGLWMYFLSPKVQWHASTMKDAALRFFAVEHLLTMLIALVLITIGYVRGKKATVDRSGFRLAFWYFLVAALLLLAGIPWPFREALGAGWF